MTCLLADCMEDLLQRALEIARQAHDGQTDKSGMPYIEHSLRVMAMGRNDEERIVGILHDVIEDSNWTLPMLKDVGFTDEIIKALDAVTRRREESYDDFISRVERNSLAVVVKLNDLTDNMDIRRLPYLSDKDVKRLKRYLKAYKRLKGEPQYSIEATRRDYPNAYFQWSIEDDEALERMWCDGVSIKDLSTYFKRKEGGICSRIKKLGLEDKYGVR